MTPTITRCGNGEFLLKLLDGERTVLTWVLMEHELQSLHGQILLLALKESERIVPDASKFESTCNDTDRPAQAHGSLTMRLTDDPL